MHSTIELCQNVNCQWEFQFICQIFDFPMFYIDFYSIICCKTKYVDSFHFYEQIRNKKKEICELILLNSLKFSVKEKSVHFFALKLIQVHCVDLYLVMSSDEQKRQLLTQKLYRNLKSKQKSSDPKSVPQKKQVNSTTKSGSQSQRCEADLTK